MAANEQIDRLLEMEKEVKNSHKIKVAMISPVADTIASFPPIVAEDVYSVSVNPTVGVYQIDEEYDYFEGFDEQDEQDKQDNKDNTSTNSPPIKLQATDSTVYPSITISTDDVQQGWNLEELERQLDTSKAKDLFTKLPKV